MIDGNALEAALDKLVGPREEFRRLLLDAEGILGRICRYARSEANHQYTKPWVIISRWTGHGSDVSKAIYELYGPKD